MSNAHYLLDRKAFLILLLLATACQNSGQGTDVKLQQGTEGITANFLESDPEVFEQQRIFAKMELHNEGFSDIIEGIIVPIYEKDLFDLISWDLPQGFSSSGENLVRFGLRGKSLSNNQGEKQIISAVLTANNIDDTRNKAKSVFSINICYPYTTVFSEPISIVQLDYQGGLER